MAQRQDKEHEADAVSEKAYGASGGDLPERRQGRTSPKGKSEVYRARDSRLACGCCPAASNIGGAQKALFKGCHRVIK